MLGMTENCFATFWNNLVESCHSVLSLNDLEMKSAPEFLLPRICSAKMQTFSLMQNFQISLAKLLQLSDIVP